MQAPFEPSTATHVRLGRTDLDVCRIGIGGGSGIDDADLDYAIGRGINYIFHSTDLHAWSYSRSAQTISKYCRKGSAHRDKVVLATVSYVNDPEKVPGVLIDQMMSLGVDHVDVFHWGWVNRRADPKFLLENTDQIVRSDRARDIIDTMARATREVGAELRCRGYARYIGISTHDRTLAAELANTDLVDVVMFRYNMSHRGAEEEIFPHLPANRPGTVAFNTSHNANGSLVNPPPGLSATNYRPTFDDLYRFVLDRPEVDVVLTGPSTREHVDVSLKALERPPLEPRLREYLCKLGDVHAGRAVIPTASA